MNNIRLTVSLAVAMTIVVSCEKDESDNGSNGDVTTGRGVYVLNEGNFYNQIDGSLSFLDLVGDSVTDNVFARANGRHLGATPNDMVIAGDYLYIACTDENLIEIVDKRTLIAGEPVAVPQPRNMVAYGGAVYVSSYDGCIHKLRDGRVTSSEKMGCCLEGITALDGKLYVCNAYNPDYTYNTNVVVADTALNHIGDITVACNPTSILNDGRTVYVLSYGDYGDTQPQVQRVGADGKAEYLCDGAMMAYHDGKLYVVSSGIDTDWQTTMAYQVLDLETRTLTTFTPGEEIEYPYSINVNPRDGEVYISSLPISEYGYGDYNNRATLVRYAPDGTFIRKYTVGVCPKTLLFTE
ncbi:MAG: hypothetical protein MJY59_00295 [Bacteroidaceae bacterium]|nr:hypothetical protein [Bacteroidaceae bacterium]